MVAADGLEHEALEYEADAEISMKDMGIDEGSRGLTTPGSSSEGAWCRRRSKRRQEREQVQSGDGKRVLPRTRQDGNAVCGR